MNKIFTIYKKLYETYGPQGWWPFINYQGQNSQKQGNTDGYHILDYSFPRDENEIFEVCLGSILTQNTTFTSVVKSLNNLNNLDCLNYKKIKDLPIEELKELIKPSGYNNQKANYILNFIEFFENSNGKIPTRTELLAIKGIGFETADSILLYGYNQAEFKVDAYTKRLLVHNKILDEKAKYNDIKSFMEEKLKKVIFDEKELVITYQEYHALIVQHSKLYYSKQPYGNGCFLNIV
ncbi:endonuclease III domain-containing protein [Arcobacter lanthieri]|uniref:endonuclease III domain-containing protein n=1 Tax=Aliarcobacter lanthieri TaxID=1355374 RepID=UPI0019237B5C|nr:endonuclease III domain-containing protein [Aliarcobacter lanthieri]